MVEISKGQAASTRSSAVLMTVGWIAAIISLLRYPFIFGVVAVICGILSTKRGSRTGLSLIVASIIFMGIGLLYSGVIWNYTSHWLGF